MVYTANKNITISKGNKIVKGQTMNAFRTLSTLKEPIMQVIISENESFNMQLSLLNKYFTQIK